MAPKATAKAAACARTKAASSVLETSKAVKSLGEQRQELKKTMLKLAAEKKKALRSARKIKAKAAKTDLGELFQMMMMKACIIVQEKKEESSGGASSSSDPWIPANPAEAFSKIQELQTAQSQAEVMEFAAQLMHEGDE